MVDNFSAERITICKSCENFNKVIWTCKLCGCFMPGKARLPLAQCPDNPPKWKTVQNEG